MKRAIVLIFLLLAYIAGFLSIKGALPFTPIFGHSMEPTLRSGSLLIIKTINPSDVKVGDIIVCNVPTSVQDYYNYPAVISHRVTEIKNMPTLGFITKGDNTSNDPFTVKPMDIRGIVAKQIPFLGLPLFFFQSDQGLIFVVTTLILLTIFLYAGELLHGGRLLRRRFSTPVLTRKAESKEKKIYAPEQNHVPAVFSQSTSKIPVKLKTTAVKIEPQAQAKRLPWHNKAIEEKDKQINGALKRQLPPKYAEKLPGPTTGVFETEKETARAHNHFESNYELPKEALAAEQEIFCALDRLRDKLDKFKDLPVSD